MFRLASARRVIPTAAAGLAIVGTSTAARADDHVIRAPIASGTLSENDPAQGQSTG